MTPKEKAEELFDKYFDKMLSFGFYLTNRQISKIALIAVDEIIKAVDNPDETYLIKHSVNYWIEVKKQIEAL
jgi:hypothetical protein